MRHNSDAPLLLPRCCSSDAPAQCPAGSLPRASLVLEKKLFLGPELQTTQSRGTFQRAQIICDGFFLAILPTLSVRAINRVSRRELLHGAPTYQPPWARAAEGPKIGEFFAPLWGAVAGRVGFPAAGLPKKRGRQAALRERRLF